MSHNGLYPNPMAFDLALQAPAFYMLHKGIRVDTAKREELKESMHIEWKKLQQSLNTVAGESLNVNSSKQIKQFIVRNGVKLRSKHGKTTADEDALRSIMAESEDKLRKLTRADAKERWLRVYLAVKLTLKIRAIRKQLSTYINMELDSDGRARCSETVGGAETARFSHSAAPWGTGTNMATIPRKLRTLFVADDGKELAELDLNRGESWVYSFLSLDPELLRIHTSFGDFHSETASAISTAFGDRHYGVEEIISLARVGGDFGYKIRYLGKKVNHSTAYRMGPFRGAEVVNAEADDTGITVTPSQFKVAQGLWKQKFFQMPHWWTSIEQQIQKNRTMKTPFGRERVFYGFFGDETYKEATAWVPQSTSVDYLNLGMLQVFNDLVSVRAFGLELLHQNHDSILVQYDIERRDEVIPELIAMLELKKHEVRVNGHEFNIPVEASYGPNWKELKEWKK